MGDAFSYDVFLCYSQKDRTKVHNLAKRLRDDGLRVWLDAWKVQNGDDEAARIESGLLTSRSLVLCMSDEALGPDWSRLEGQTLRFRDPRDKDRRFVPLRLDDAPIPGALDQLEYIDWRKKKREKEYATLLDLCRPAPSTDLTEAQKRFEVTLRSLGHTDWVRSVAWSPDGRWALSGAEDNTLRLWEVETGRAIAVFEGHTEPVSSVAWSPDGRRALSGSEDNTLRLWEVETGRAIAVFEGHTGTVLSVAWSPDGRRVLSGSQDSTLRLWGVETGRAVAVFEGHTGPALSVAWSPDGRRALSGASDKTLRLWEVETGRAIAVFEGHTGSVQSVAWSPDGARLFSAASNGVMRIWTPVEPSTIPSGTSAEASGTTGEQVQYTNAKVLLVGDSGAGKTGLSFRLATGQWQPSPGSTIGAWATQVELPVNAENGIEREIWLWDFGGQADQRLIHQLYMNKTSLAVLVFDGQKDDLFDSLGQWDRDLLLAARNKFPKLLALGRKDAGGLRGSRTRLEAFAKERGYEQPLETSARTGEGCDDLKRAIVEGIRWNDIPWRASPRVFKRLKEELLRVKDEGRVLVRFNELRDNLRLRMVSAPEPFSDEELKAVISLLEGPGAVWNLPFGEWVLLHPERINTYAQAVIQTLREDPEERGCIAESKVLGGDLKYASPEMRLPREDERIVLLAMHELLVKRALCLRQETANGTLLVFPSYYRQERPPLTGHPSVQVTYRFEGFLDDIYATLVVRLHHTDVFDKDELYRYAADFKTVTEKKLGVRLTRQGEGRGELDVYFEPAVPVGEKIQFSKFIHEHLREKASNVERLRHYVCPHCGTESKNRDVAMEKLNDWLDGRSRAAAGGTSEEGPTLLCIRCEQRFPLWDEMEQYFASPEAKQKVADLQKQAEIELDNESKDRVLVGEVISTVALAGQICREVLVSDHGIDMEIEFKDDLFQATGQRIYLQLKSGDFHLKERRRDGMEVFQIRKPHHVTLWRQQAYPVLLVVRTSDGEIRWMEIRDYLERVSDGGRKPVTQIQFEGERFNVMSVRRWRDRMLGLPSGEPRRQTTSAQSKAPKKPSKFQPDRSTETTSPVPSTGGSSSRTSSKGAPPKSGSQGTCRAALEAFLCSAFSSAELRRLFSHDDALAPLVNDVHWDRPIIEVAEAVVAHLERHGFITADFFAMLKKERPRRADDIHEVQTSCQTLKQS